MKLRSFVGFVLLILVSCSKKNGTTSVIWISGFKTTCESGAGASNCLLINKSNELANEEWELFYSDIEGFEFQEGYLKKVEILRQKPNDNKRAPMDKSISKYVLVKELEKRQDHRPSLVAHWQLEGIHGTSIDKKITPPTLDFNLSEMKIHGNGGCNRYDGTIKQLGIKSIAFGNVLNTLSICAEVNVEGQYLGSLDKISSYEVNDSILNLYDGQENVIMSFVSHRKTDNRTKIHDIWSAVRIAGSPTKGMVPVPHLEINTTEMKIYGNNGCNDYFGTLTNLTENSISFGKIGSTRKMCPEMEVPKRYNEALLKTRTFRFDGQALIFSDEEGEEILTFMKTD